MHAYGCNYCRHGDTVYFGSYPQTLVTSTALSDALNELAGNLPGGTKPNNWTSYRYYLGGSKSNYMWYIDLTYHGVKYRGVYFNQNRPGLVTNTDTGRQGANGYETNTVYWFEFKPIQWRVLKSMDGNTNAVMIFCEMAIDSQEFYHSTDDRTIDGNTIHANNYEYSDIRTWLNETFYQTAFSEAQQGMITAYTQNNVDNSARSTMSDANATQWNSGNNPYACNNTTDKIFLLSTQQATSASLGFNTAVDAKDPARLKAHTDYAACQGCWSSDGYTPWMLRSPFYEWKTYFRDVSSDGTAGSPYESSDAASYEVYVTDTRRGIVPALTVVLN